MLKKLITAGKIFFINSLNEYSRYKSWEFCYIKFNNNNLNIDELAMYLTLYLASWGMFRNSFLMFHNYKINKNIVKIILKFKNEHKIKLEDKNDLEKIVKDINFFKDIENLSNSIEEEYIKLKNDNKKITNTLKTKIIMGTLGLTPAYDSLFKNTLDDINKELNFYIPKNFNADSLKKCYEFYLENYAYFDELKKEVDKTVGFNYPIMKILDMCFWQYAMNKKINNN